MRSLPYSGLSAMSPTLRLSRKPLEDHLSWQDRVRIYFAILFGVAVCIWSFSYLMPH